METYLAMSAAVFLITATVLYRRNVPMYFELFLFGVPICLLSVMFLCAVSWLGQQISSTSLNDLLLYSFSSVLTGLGYYALLHVGKYRAYSAQSKRTLALFFASLFIVYFFVFMSVYFSLFSD